MGTVKVTIAVGDPQGQMFEDLEVRWTLAQPSRQCPENCSVGWEYQYCVQPSPNWRTEATLQWK